MQKKDLSLTLWSYWTKVNNTNKRCIETQIFDQILWSSSSDGIRVRRKWTDKGCSESPWWRVKQMNGARPNRKKCMEWWVCLYRSLALLSIAYTKGLSYRPLWWMAAASSILRLRVGSDGRRSDLHGWWWWLREGRLTAAWSVRCSVY